MIRGIQGATREPSRFFSSLVGLFNTSAQFSMESRAIVRLLGGVTYFSRGFSFVLYLGYCKRSCSPGVSAVS